MRGVAVDRRALQQVEDLRVEADLGGLGDVQPRRHARLAGNSPPPVLAERFAELADSPEAPPSMLPDISSELLPWVMRGAADSDYPDPEAVSALAQPVLILAEAGDPGHPESTARRLHELLPQSELHIANHLPEMRAWGERIDAFLN